MDLKFKLFYKNKLVIKIDDHHDFLLNNNIILEMHGDYWHGNPNKYDVLNERQTFKQNRDVEKQKFAEDNGYQYHVIWEHDVRTNNFTKIQEIINDQI